MVGAASILGLGTTLAATQAGAQTGQAAPSAVVEEIIVTATKQAVALNKVAISISAYDSKALDTRSIHNVTDLARQTPGVNVSTGFVSPMEQRISVRGIDSTAGAATTAVYVDDTAIQSPVGGLNYAGSTVPQIFDLERVEVLRGPQGTLFGASAEGGAIRFITPTPSLTTVSTYAKVSLGKIDGGATGGEVGFAIGAPIIEDKAGFRLSYGHRLDAGYVDRVSWANGERTRNVNSGDVDVARLAVLLQPTEWLSLTPAVFYQKYAINDTALQWRSLSKIGDGDFVTGFANRQPAVDNYVLPSLRTVISGAGLELTSVTSWLQRHQTQSRDQTNIMGGAYLGASYPTLSSGEAVSTMFNTHSRQQNFAEELRLANTDADSRLKWQLGVYYSLVRQRSYGVLDSPNFNAALLETYGVDSEVFYGAPLVNGSQLYNGSEFTRERQLAAFANLDYKITPDLTLTLAGRYGKDEIDYEIVERDPSFGTSAPSFNEGRLKEKPFTPKVALSWQRTDDQLYYAAASKGFRAGGVNSTLPRECSADLASLGFTSTPRTYEADSTWNYEVGNKSRLLGGRLAVDSSAFFVRWNNIQQAVRLGCFYSVVLNSGQAESKGFDMNVSYRATSDLSIGGSVGYTDAKYTHTVVSAGGVIAQDGQTLGSTPWSLEFWLDYKFTALGLPAYIRIQDNYKSRNDGLYGQQIAASAQYDANFLPDDAYNHLDLRLGMKIKSLDVALFAQNALNDHPKFITQSLPASPEVLQTSLRPRYVGIEAIFRY